MKEKKLVQNQILYKEGDDIKEVFFVKEGEFVVSKKLKKQERSASSPFLQGRPQFDHFLKQDFIEQMTN